MFWQAVAGGVRVLFYWETWAGMLVYGVLLFLPMIVLGLAAQRDMRFGCLGMLILPITQVIACVVVLWILLPIILGLGTDASWGFPLYIALHDPAWMVKTVGLLLLAAILSAFVPILGRIATFTNFVVGSYAIAIATRAFAMASGNDAFAHVSYFPGFGTALGFLIVGGAFSALAGLGLAGVTVMVNSRNSAEDSRPGPLSMSAFGILGLIPSFMYGAWLGLQFKAAIP